MEEKLRAKMLDRQKVKKQFDEITKKKKDLQSEMSSELEKVTFKVE